MAELQMSTLYSWLFRNQFTFSEFFQNPEGDDLIGVFSGVLGIDQYSVVMVQITGKQPSCSEVT